MAERHIFGPLLKFVADYYGLMTQRDQDLFLWVWDQWMRAAADVRQHLGETDLAKSLHTILPFGKHLNMGFVFDPAQATYRRGIVRGTLSRATFPEQGTNVLTWASDHVALDEVRKGDILVFESGADNHPNVIHIRDVFGSGVETEEVFRSEQGDAIVYRVDRGVPPTAALSGCVEVYPIDPTYTGIPTLSTTVGPSGRVLVEGADFALADGFIGFFSPTPRQHLEGVSFFFAPEVHLDEEIAYHTFGFPIGFRRETSEQYVRGLQALYFALWSGPARFNMETGIAVILGLPFSTPGVVTSVGRVTAGWEVTVEGVRGTYSYQIPDPFKPNVVRGQQVGFQALSDMTRVIDYVSNPEFIEFIGLKPRLDQFHTFFALINYEVLQSLSGADLPAVIEFLDRARDARTNFQLLIEIPIPERLALVADAPQVDTRIRAHAMIGPNWANRMRIDAFASPGLAQPYGYRTDFVLSQVAGTVVSFRDSADELIVEYSSAFVPEDDALAGKFRFARAGTSILSGSFSAGVWDGTDTLVLTKASFPDWTKVRAGDVLHTSGSAIQRNDEAFSIESVADLGASFALTFDRENAAEDGLSFTVKRLYPIKSNRRRGDSHTIVLEPATLVADGLEDGASFEIWRQVIGGIAMVEDYEAGADSGRADFSTWTIRRAALVGADAIALDDRVKITLYDEDDSVISTYDERDVLGDPRDTIPTTLPPTTP